MEYICPYCGHSIKKGIYCNVCLNKISSFQKICNKSIVYYNRGLEAAQNRELSLGCIYLQKAIVLYKYNIEARNLLGLIYLEIGQVSNALKEWIISSSLKKVDNKAINYIESIQKQPKYLTNGREAILLYNKARYYLKQKNIETAIIRLNRAVKLQPKLVEARVLLALAYIKKKQMHHAYEQIQDALKIDKSHKEALCYFNMLSQKSVQDKAEDKKGESVHQFKAIHDGIRLDWRVSFKNQMLYFFLGILVMGGMSRYLVLPSKIKDYELREKQLTAAKETLAQEIQILSEEYEIKLTELKNDKANLEEEVTSYKEETTILEEKEKLNKVIKLVEEKEYTEAANILYQIRASYLQEEDIGELEELKIQIYPNAAEILYNEGIAQYNNKQYIEAVASLEKVLFYDPPEWMLCDSLYYLAQICEINEDKKSAKRYYEQIIAEYPNTRQADMSNQQLVMLNESQKK